MFRELDGDAALIVENGVFRLAPLFEYDGYLFAKVNGGFVKLYENGSTSKIAGNKNPQQISSIHLSSGTVVYRDQHGRLMISARQDNAILSAPSAAKLGLPAPEGIYK